MFTIDRTTYSKLRHQVGTGYSLRPIGGKPKRIVVHSTNGNRGSTFDGEGRFLRDSAAVGAHYLVGKQGEIAEILPPKYAAWHAGLALPGWGNDDTIGIECHHAKGEVWTATQKAALTWLVQQLMSECSIGRDDIETHRRIATPAGRKEDPSDWPDEAFYAWRALLVGEIDMTVIGVVPSVTKNQFLSCLSDHRAPLSQIEAGRVYDQCGWLEIDPAFMAALWHAESDFGKSELQLLTRCPINIKVPDIVWPERDTVKYRGARWASYESFQLGMMASVLHVKQVHGSKGRTTVRQVVYVHAPPTENDTERIIKNVLEDIAFIRQR